ncbi:MAG: hypothetical protein DCC75_11880, partial [Proteobacteria bacterium]
MSYRRIIVFLIVLCAAAIVYFTSRPRENAIERIVFVTIDTLRADHLSSYGYPRSTSPFIDSLAHKGLVFDNAFSACSHTAPSHASMFTGLYPFRHQVLRNGEGLNKNTYSIIKWAAEIGLEPWAFSSVAFMERRFGFSELREEDRPPGTEISKRLRYRRAEKQIDQVLHWLGLPKRPEKFFL